MKSQLAHTPCGDIEYTLRGSGPVVLVCHGTSNDCFSSELGGPLAEAGFKVLTPSRPGYGRTPLETGRGAEQAAEALAALLDTLGIEKCSVLAVSGGGPTGIALAAKHPERVSRLILAAAVSRPEKRPEEPGYQRQMGFYGPAHRLTWGMLGLMSRLSPRSMARQTLIIFSTHDPEEGLKRLSADDIQRIARFYQGHSSRAGALNDAGHTVGKDLLQQVRQPTLVIHSREDSAVPFAQAEWTLENIPRAEMCEGGFMGHFLWIGPDAGAILERMKEFLQ